MSLSEKFSNSIHIMDPWKAIEVKTTTNILRDDVTVASSNSIQVYYPGEDLSDAPTEVQNIASVLWTTEIIEAFNQQTAVQPLPEIPEDQVNLGLPVSQEIGEEEGASDLNFPVTQEIEEEEEAVPFQS